MDAEEAFNMLDTVERAQPHVEVRRLVRNCSSRHGASPLLIVVHDTEGANLPGLRDLQGLADWFDNPAAQASSHVATDADGNSARFVRDEDKAWHVAFYNPVSLGIEQVGFASQKTWTLAEQAETARWIAYWSKLHGIPIRKGRVTLDGRVACSGVVRHSELGNLGRRPPRPGPELPVA
jgi:hypothetical protein